MTGNMEQIANSENEHRLRYMKPDKSVTTVNGDSDEL